MNAKYSVRNCPLCGGLPTTRPWKTVTDSFAYKYQLPPRCLYNLYKCAKCGMVFVSPLPEIIERQELYRESMIDYKNKSHPKSRHYRTVSIIKKLISSGKILELGASYGMVLKMLVEAGYDASGIEPDRKAAESAQSMGIDVRQGMPEKVVAESDFGKYDLVVADNVMEHVPEVQSLAYLTARLLRPGGIMLVIVPNLYDWRRFLIPQWGYKCFWHPIEHINYFSVNTLKQLFKNSGVEPFAIRLKKKSPSWTWRLKEFLEKVNIYPLGLYIAGRKP